MRIIVHVGMHKTGSTSIQDTFFRFKDPSFEYVDWLGANHGGLFMLLFLDEGEVARYHGFASRGAQFTRRLPELRAIWGDKLDKQLAAADGKTLLFSGEDISGPRLAQADRRLAAFFRERCDRVDVIGYARAPQSFAASAFQQRLKGGNLTTKPKPDYRARFEKIDHAFGRENVTLREFSRERLIGGDVVRDFAETVGIAIPPEDKIVRTNESLSLEATALLYVQRKFGQGYLKGFNATPQANSAFIARLAQIGARKLVFSDAMMAPMLEEIADDIAWMEERLGHPFSDSGSASPDAISSFDDLVEIALQNYDKVLEILGDNAPKAGEATVGKLVEALEVLRENCYEAEVPGGAYGSSGRPLAGTKGHPNRIGEAARPSGEDLQLYRKLARILWNLDMGDLLPASKEDRAEAFRSVEADYLSKAQQFSRQLRNNELELVTAAQLAGRTR